MIFPNTIDTPRLLLRKPIAPDDAPRIFASYASDPEVTRYLRWRPHYDVAESLRILRTRLEWWDEGREFSWVITTRTDGEIIGMISATAEDSATRFSIGYVLARSHWGLGNASEAAEAVTHLLLTQPSVTRVGALVDCDHTASIRVLERAGMQREGLRHGASVHPAFGPTARDCWSYALTR